MVHFGRPQLRPGSTPVDDLSLILIGGKTITMGSDCLQAGVHTTVLHPRVASLPGKTGWLHGIDPKIVQNVTDRLAVIVLALCI